MRCSRLKLKILRAVWVLLYLVVIPVSGGHYQISRVVILEEYTSDTRRRIRACETRYRSWNISRDPRDFSRQSFRRIFYLLLQGLSLCLDFCARKEELK